MVTLGVRGLFYFTDLLTEKVKTHTHYIETLLRFFLVSVSLVFDYSPICFSV